MFLIYFSGIRAIELGSIIILSYVISIFIISLHTVEIFAFCFLKFQNVAVFEIEVSSTMVVVNLPSFVFGFVDRTR